MPVFRKSHEGEKRKPFKRYVLFAIWLLLILAAATVNDALIEKRPPQAALIESLCSMFNSECVSTDNLSTKLMHVLLGLSSMAVLVLLISEGVDYMLELDLKGKRLENTISRYKNHIVVCGYGALGKTACEAFSRNNEPFVIVDLDPKVVFHLREQGIPAVEGDALDLKVLEKAGVKRAKRLVSALGSDSNNVFLTLTAKELKPDIKIATRAFTEEAIKKLHRAGADVIVMPEIEGGKELAREILNMDGVHGESVKPLKKE